MTNETVKGFKDFSGEDAEKRAEIRKVLVEVFERYGFEPAETPIVEYESFVKEDNANDEAVSDIFKLKDRGKRKLALRYELTFPLKRLMKNKRLPYKRYQIGEVFRDEPVSSNRFRQFTQGDVDVIGSSIKDEAEILALTKNVLKELGIEAVIYIGNRKLLNEILEKQGITTLKGTSKNKEQVLREIDKLDKLSEKDVAKNLKKLGAEKILSVFKKKENYFERYDAYKDILELKKFCNYYGVKVEFQPSLVRGLSYYNGNVFEVKGKGINTLKGTSNSICGGGSFMFNKVQSTGISFGLDRLINISKIKNKKPNVMIISIGQDREAIKVVEKLRKKGENCLIYYGKPSKALGYANSKEINKVIFVGKDEVKKKKFKEKDMGSGKQKYISIN